MSLSFNIKNINKINHKIKIITSIANADNDFKEFISKFSIQHKNIKAHNIMMKHFFKIMNTYKKVINFIL